jgi:predicted Fe-Mo cluster-binding NifX family protein
VVGRIPFDPIVNDAQAAGCSVVEFAPHSAAARAIRATWRRVEQRLGRTPPEKGPSMRLAIPVSRGILAQHFGHCDNFELIDVDTAKKEILQRRTVAAPPHQPGLLPGWLAERGAEVILAGGIGSRALQGFTAHDISVIVGVPELDPESLVRNYLDGNLQTGDNVCDH